MSDTAEKIIDTALREEGYLLTARVVIRNVVFGRPPLFPPSWTAGQHERFTQTNTSVVERMQKLALSEAMEDAGYASGGDS